MLRYHCTAVINYNICYLLVTDIYEHVLENKVMRKMFGPEKDEMGNGRNHIARTSWYRHIVHLVMSS